MQPHFLFLLVALCLAGCHSMGEPESRIRVGGNSPTGMYAGAASLPITPIISEIFIDLDFASDATGYVDHRAPNGIFDGELHVPRGNADLGIEGFYDIDNNGLFEPIWLAGSAMRRPASGVHDDLSVRALAFRSGEKTVIFVTFDLYGVPFEEVAAIREAAAEQVEFDELTVSASNTHQAPDSLGLWGPDDSVSGSNLEYRAFVRRTSVDAIVAAARAAVPVALAVTTASIASPAAGILAGNLQHDARDPVVIDDNIAILQFLSIPSLQPIITLVNWAGQPAHMRDDNQISSDYVHTLRERLEAQFPESVALFVNGAIGGRVGPARANVIYEGKRYAGEANRKCRVEGHSFQRDQLAIEHTCPEEYATGDQNYMWRKAAAVGHQVADRVVALLADAAIEKSVALSFFSREVYLPVDNQRYRMRMAKYSWQDRAFFKDDQGSPVVDRDAFGIDARWFIRTEVKRIDFWVNDRESAWVQILTIPGNLDPEFAVGGAVDASRTGGVQPFVKPACTVLEMEATDQCNPSPPFPRLPDTACVTPPCWDTSIAMAGPGLRGQMQGKHTFLFGITQDALGELVPEYQWKLDSSQPYVQAASGDHAEELHSLGPETATRLLEAYGDLLAE